MNPAIHAIDMLVVLGYLLGVVVFGLWIGRDQKDLSDYLLGSRDIPWWGIMGSIVATETSTATFLSVPGITFAPQGDFRFLQLAMGFVVGRLVVSLAFLPLYFRGALYSAYEVLEHRFGGATKRTASVMFLVARNLGDGLRLFLAGLVLEQVLGIDLMFCIVIMGILTIVYTFFGGMKAIVWTDCIQFVVYISGGLLAGFLIVRAIPNGWQGLFTFAREQGKLHFISLDTDLTQPYTLWAGLVGGVMLTLGTHGTDQMMVQRYLSARSRAEASLALIGSGIVVFLQFFLFLLLGVGLACFYSHFPPATPFARADEVFASFIVTQLPVGAVGILLAAVASAAMSTLSSSLNSSASAAVNDFYLPMRGIDPTSKQALAATRLLTVLFGFLQIAIGIASSYLSRSVVTDALSIAGLITGVLLGVFALGVLTRNVPQQGALIGMVGGAIVLIFIRFGTSIAWPWYALIGSVTTFVIGIVATKLFKFPVSTVPSPLPPTKGSSR